MSAPRFRVGDVVRTADGLEGTLRRCDAIGDWLVEDWGWRASADLTLLRRPVQVGDVLRDANGVEPDFHVVRVDRDLALDADCSALSLHMRSYLDRWTHEDGTPLEPPRPVAEVPSGKDCPECGGGLNQFDHVCVCSLAPWSRREPVAEDPSIARKARESAVHALSLTKGWEETAFFVGHGIIWGEEALTVRDMPVTHAQPAPTLTPATYASVDSIAKSVRELQGIPLRADPWMPRDTFAIVSPHSVVTGKLPTRLPDVDTLARALFDTDPEVIAFVEQVADAHVRKHVTRWNAVTMRADTVQDLRDDAPERYDAALQRAWDRDEHGWATRATARAEAVLAKLGGAR